MSLVLEAQSVPIKVDQDGMARVGGTRVVLDLLVNAYQAGASAEAIAEEYDAVALADVYAVIAYYLRHRDDVNAYMNRNAEESEKLRREIESRSDTAEWRKRLLAREAERKTKQFIHG